MAEDSNTFRVQVEGLIAQGRMYHNEGQFALNIGLLMQTDQARAMELLNGMVQLARRKANNDSNREAHRSRRWLSRLAMALDSIQMFDRQWISAFVYELPNLSPSEQESQSGASQMDYRSREDPYWESHDFLDEPILLPPLGAYTRASGRRDDDLGPDSRGFALAQEDKAICPEVLAGERQQQKSSKSHKRGSWRSFSDEVPVFLAKPSEQHCKRKIASTVTQDLSREESLNVSVHKGKQFKMPRYNLSQVRKDLENQRRYERRRRNTMCWVPDCSIKGLSYLKVHALSSHIPTVFDGRVVGSNNIQERRKQGLLQVAQCLLGRPATLDDLLELVNHQHMLGRTETVIQGSNNWDVMVAFCNYLGIVAPLEFTLSPVNSVGALLHWKVLYMLVALLEAGDREYLRTTFTLPADEDETSRAFDSHFHADRLATLAKISMNDVLKIENQTGARVVCMQGGVANFCDPDTYPTDMELDYLGPGLMASVGIHPKYAARSSQFLQDAILRMGSLLSHPRVFGIGEVGLDHSLRPDSWASQMTLIEKIIPYVTNAKVLVIHCKRIPGNNGYEVHQLLLHLLRGLSEQQKIHIHSFDGDCTIMDWWLSIFPNTHFSFNRGVASFNNDQIEAIKSMDASKIMVETNAPYFSQEGQDFSVPKEVYDVAELVAWHRDVSTQHILEVTTENALYLYD